MDTKPPTPGASFSQAEATVDPEPDSTPALPKPTPKRIEEVIQQTISRKLEDGQFDESDLTLREIHEVGEGIREAVLGFLGPRIEYPQEQENLKKKMAKAAQAWAKVTTTAKGL